jgi:hypothetical protein
MYARKPRTLQDLGQKIEISCAAIQVAAVWVVRLRLLNLFLDLLIVESDGARKVTDVLLYMFFKVSHCRRKVSS